MEDFKWTDKLVIEYGNWYFKTQGNPGELWGVDLLEHFKKSKQPKPILTTEDGVALYEDFHKAYVLTAFWTINEVRITRYEYDTHKDHCKYFSTKEAAEEYKLLNQPCLSVNDICSVGIMLYKGESILKKIAAKKQNTFTVNHKQ